jgi:S1-C subfamily serine protease
MEFHDFQLRAWAADKEQAAVFVHSSPAGAMQRPETAPLNWESLGRFQSLVQFQSARNATSAELMAGGRELANVLFPTDARELLTRSLGRLDPEDGLRVRLCLDVALSDLPWEYLFLPNLPALLKSSGGFLALDARVSLVRQPPQPGRDKPKLRKKRRLLFFGTRNCAADGRDLWGIAKEKNLLWEALKPASSLLEMRAVLSDESDCTTALNSSARPIDIFHYSGHTDVQNGGGYLIASEIREGGPNAARLYADALGPLLRRANTTVAVFSACNSGSWAFVEPLLRSEIPVVVGARGLVEVRVATAFCERLYSALAVGLSLDEAVTWARLHLLEPTVLPEFLKWQWGTFMVYMQTPDAILFPRPRKPQVADEQRAARIARHLTTSNFDPFYGDWSAIDKNARRSILFVETVKQKRDGTNRETPTGTAFVVSGLGYALTAAHVVPEAPSDEMAQYRVALRSREAPLAEVQVVTRDTQLDLALLRLPDTCEWMELPIGDSRVVSTGAPLYALGFPRNLDLSGAPGTLSNTVGLRGLWQTTIPLEHGHSGGPIFDQSGRVVAIASSGFDDAKALTYAIPVHYAEPLLRSILSPAPTPTA